MTLMATAVASEVSDAATHTVNNQLLGRGADIQTLGATICDDLLASDEVVAVCALWIGEYRGLPGATWEGITLDSPGNTDPSTGRDEEGAEVVVVAEQALHEDISMTTFTSRQPGRSQWLAGHGSCVRDPLTTRLPGLLLSSLSPSPPCS